MLRLVLVFLGIGVLGCQADCNVCSIASAACVSDSQFRFCEDNIPVDPVNICPTGQYCTGDTTICQSNKDKRACNECGQCNEKKVFACLGVRTFALCLGTTVNSSITGSCAPDRVCSINNDNICGTAAEGFAPTCSSLNDEVIPTPSPETSPDTYCRTIQRAGRFPYGSTISTTCRQYIQCYIRGNIWYGALYTCPGQTYFQPTVGLCNTTVPASCTSGVQSLQLLNLRLL